MKTKKMLLCFIFCLVAGMMFFMTTNKCAAVEEGATGIASIFNKPKGEGPEKKLEPWQFWVGLGAFPVMFIVVKWL